jgi:hypothetical protein
MWGSPTLNPLGRPPARGFAAPPPPQPMIAYDWRPFPRRTMCGFFSLQLASGLQLRGCTLHKKGRDRWVGLPCAAQIDKNGQFRVVGGKRVYFSLVAIPDRHVRERFQAQALAALDKLLADVEAA